MPCRSRRIASTRSLPTSFIDLLEFLLGAQIDGAEPFAFVAICDRVSLRPRRWSAVPNRVDLGELGRALRIERLADLVLDVGEPPLGGVAAFLAAGSERARFADRLERRALSASASSFSASASRSAAMRRSAVAVSISPISGSGKSLRRGLQFVALVFGLDAALARWRSCAAAPSRRSLHSALGGNCLQTPVRKLGFARTAPRPAFRRRCCVRLADAELGLDVGRGRQCGGPRQVAGQDGFVAADGGARLRLGERRDARRIAADLALVRRDPLARRVGWRAARRARRREPATLPRQRRSARLPPWRRLGVLRRPRSAR